MRKIALFSGLTVVVVLAVFVWACWGEIRFFVLFQPLGKNAEGYWVMPEPLQRVVLVES